MKLRVNGAQINIESTIHTTVNGKMEDINQQVVSRAYRSVNELRNAERHILEGQRSGKVYRKPGTYGAPTKTTRRLKKEYAHKLRGGQLYRASAPGEAPAKRTGALRLHWNDQVKRGSSSSTRMEIIATLESGERYASLLENGTSRVAPRPFVEQIKEKAMPEIEKIYGEPFS